MDDPPIDVRILVGWKSDGSSDIDSVPRFSSSYSTTPTTFVIVVLQSITKLAKTKLSLLQLTTKRCFNAHLRHTCINKVSPQRQRNGNPPRPMTVNFFRSVITIGYIVRYISLAASSM